MAKNHSKRSGLREFAPFVLRAANIDFTSHNRGMHLIVKLDDGRAASYWPGAQRLHVSGWVESRQKVTVEEFARLVIKGEL